jgi:hypothetical protein
VSCGIYGGWKKVLYEMRRDYERRISIGGVGYLMSEEIKPKCP